MNSIQQCDIKTIILMVLHCKIPNNKDNQVFQKKLFDLLF